MRSPETLMAQIPTEGEHFAKRLQTARRARLSRPSPNARPPDFMKLAKQSA
jgi:hypothetical protein